MRFWIFFLLIVAVLAGVAGWTKRDEFFKPEIPGVTVFRASLGPVEEVVSSTSSGRVMESRKAALSSEIGARVEEMMVRRGDWVDSGQMLIRLTQDDFRAQVELQHRAVESSRAGQNESCRAVGLAENELKRAELLASGKLIPQQQIDEIRDRRDAAIASCETSGARLRQAEVALTVAQNNLSKTVIKAPFAGLVTSVSTEVGEFVTPSPPGVLIPPILEIIDTTSLYVSAPIDELDMKKVRPGLPARITLGSMPGETFLGRVKRLAPIVRDVLQGQQRTFDIDVELDTPGERARLVPGASADVTVVLAAQERVLRIPTRTILQGDHVLVVGDNGQIQSVPVTLGLSSWEFTEVRSGIKEGAAVVVSLDRPEIRPGLPVVIEAETDQ